MPRIICEVRPACLISPLTVVVTARSDGSMSVVTHGPIGQNVSKPFARPHCDSRFCRSRAVTSLAQVKPSTTSFTRSGGTSRQSRAMTTASSPSKSTCSEMPTGYCTASPGPITDVDGLRNTTGGSARSTSPPISFACSA